MANSLRIAALASALWLGLACGGAVGDGGVPSDDALSSTKYQGLAATYFKGESLQTPVLMRLDASLDFDWGTGAPAGGVPADELSVRWTGSVLAPATGTFTFTTTTDDGVRLWVNGQQLVNDWADHPARSTSGSIQLVAGQRYDLRAEYFERTGLASMKLFWQGPGFARTLVPAAALSPLPAGDACVSSDVFCDAVHHDTSPSYTLHNGAWSRAGGVISARETQSMQRAWASLAPVSGDFDATVVGASVGSAGFGLVYGTTSAGSGAVLVHPSTFQGVYVKELSATGEDLFTPVSVPQPTAFAGVPRTLRVQRVGAKLTVWLDGVSLFEGKDPLAGRAGTLGLLTSTASGAGGADFLLFRVAGQAVSPLPPPANDVVARGFYPSQTSIQNYQSWFGSAEVDVVGSYTYDANWNGITSPNALVLYKAWVAASPKHHVNLGVQPYPVGGSLSACAAGDYDAYYQQMGANFARAGMGSTYFRFAWEDDGDWFTWGTEVVVTDPTTGKKTGHYDAARMALYKKCFQSFYVSLKKTDPEGQVSWYVGYDDTFNQGTYPGDAYVDRIVRDFYDEGNWSDGYPFPTPCDATCMETRQDHEWEVNFGPKIIKAANFATSKGRPFDLGEWGIAWKANASGGLDDPHFIQHVFDLMHGALPGMTPGFKPGYESYFDAYTDPDANGKPTIDTRLYSSATFTTHFPQSAALFRETFGVAGK